MTRKWVKGSDVVAPIDSFKIQEILLDDDRAYTVHGNREIEIDIDGTPGIVLHLYVDDGTLVIEGLGGTVYNPQKLTPARAAILHYQASNRWPMGTIAADKKPGFRIAGKLYLPVGSGATHRQLGVWIREGLSAINDFLVEMHCILEFLPPSDASPEGEIVECLNG